MSDCFGCVVMVQCVSFPQLAWSKHTRKSAGGTYCNDILLIVGEAKQERLFTHFSFDHLFNPLSPCGHSSSVPYFFFCWIFISTQNRKYSTRDYIVVFLIVTGLATFMNAETRASENLDTPFSFLGVGCIVLALVVDAAIINIQVRKRPSSGIGVVWCSVV